MDFLLLAVALCLLLLGGLGISRLLLPNCANSAELFALSFLFGSAVISLSLFVFGLFVSGIALRLLVTTACIALGWIGWRRSRVSNLRVSRGFDTQAILLLAINVVQIATVGWLSSVRTLGWDGLFNFEVKARLAFLNGGVIPLEYFSDPSRSWTLQSYPLLLPLTENWLYLWLGRADQQLVKIVFLMFFISALCLLNTGNRLLGVVGWRRLLASLLIFIVPLLIVGDGGASSGYADFPLAVFYLAAVIYLAEFWQSGNRSALQTATVIAACGCWLKQDGAILWLCVMALATIKLPMKTIRGWFELAKASLPGLLVMAGWQLFVRGFSLAKISQFSPVSFSTLRVNLWRAPVVAQAVLGELTNWRHWGALWLIAATAILAMFWQKKTKLALLPLALVLPLGLYSSVYVFSIWPSFIAHLESSFPRLLIHLSLVAELTIGAAMPFRLPGSARQ